MSKKYIYKPFQTLFYDDLIIKSRVEVVKVLSNRSENYNSKHVHIYAGMITDHKKSHFGAC